jgi:hypothetical protein
MRITRDTLLNLARENSSKMIARDRGIACVYIGGSLLNEDSFLAGITDIDLFFIHDRPVPTPREVVRINADVHLDIAHFEQEAFAPARKLRTDPWLGSLLARGPMVLHDPSHWLDYTRSAGTAQFNHPENVSGRVKYFLSPARLTWQSLQDGAVPQGVRRVQALLEVIRDSANAAAVITGAPLPVRRLFLDLPERTTRAGMPELAGELVQSFTSESVTDDHWAEWFNGWENAYDQLNVSGKAPVTLNPSRKNYYLKAIKGLSEERPAAALWMLLFTWTRMASGLSKTEEPYKSWQSLCRQLELDNKNFLGRLDLLDSALDRIEESLDRLRS